MEADFMIGYRNPLEKPISGSHNLNLENCSKLDPAKKIRALLI